MKSCSHACKHLHLVCIYISQMISGHKHIEFNNLFAWNYCYYLLFFFFIYQITIYISLHRIQLRECLLLQLKISSDQLNPQGNARNPSTFLLSVGSNISLRLVKSSSLCAKIGSISTLPIWCHYYFSSSILRRYWRWHWDQEY